MDRPTVTSRLTALTPEDAQLLAARFHAPGRVDQRLVKAYAQDMRAGRWQTNGAAVILSSDGRVLDGRCRILAAIQANCAFETLVVEGVDAASFETIDVVRKRRLADVLSMKQHRHGRSLGAGLKVIWSYLSGAPEQTSSVSSVPLLDLLGSHPEISDSVEPALTVSSVLPPSLGIALHYLLGLSNEQKCDQFFGSLADDRSLHQPSSIALLRKALLDLKLRGGRRQAYIFAVCIKAWNAFVEERPIRLLRYDPERERFPQIAGLQLPQASQTEAGPLFERSIERHQASAKGQLTASVMLIGPLEAEQMLANNTLNRKISGAVVDKYARDMAEGRWRLNGQAIKLTTDGKLLDGQHRLEAAKKAGASFWALVATGVSEATIGSLDVGRHRGLAEVLRDRGEVHTTVLASALRWLWMLERNLTLGRNVSPTNGEMLEYLSKNPKIRDSVKFTYNIREIMSGGIAAAHHYEFQKYDVNDAREFFARLIDGLNLSSENPVYYLRERLLKTRQAYKVRMSEIECAAFVRKTWNAYRGQRQLQQLSWRTRGPAREGLPSII